MLTIIICFGLGFAAAKVCDKPEALKKETLMKKFSKLFTK